MLNSERVLWLSHVCEVITEPSAEAFLPTVTTVHSSRRPSCPRPAPDAGPAADTRTKVPMKKSAAFRDPSRAPKKNVPKESSRLMIVPPV
jgi:hypothetical protein